LARPGVPPGLSHAEPLEIPQPGLAGLGHPASIPRARIRKKCSCYRNLGILWPPQRPVGLGGLIVVVLMRVMGPVALSRTSREVVTGDAHAGGGVGRKLGGRAGFPQLFRPPARLLHPQRGIFHEVEKGRSKRELGMEVQPVTRKEGSRSRSSNTAGPCSRSPCGSRRTQSGNPHPAAATSRTAATWDHRAENRRARSAGRRRSAPHRRGSGRRRGGSGEVLFFSRDDPIFVAL